MKSPVSRLQMRWLWAPLGIALVLAASPAQAVRVVSWNILNYPSASGNSREDDHRVVLADMQPDLIVAQEITTTSGATEWLNDVLNTMEPGQWAMAPFTNGADTDNACYYKTAVFDYVSNVVLSTTLRQIDGWKLRLDGYTGAAAEVNIYSLHLKASQGSTNEARREEEAEVLRNHLNQLPPTSNIIVGGDTNIYDSGEPAWAMLTGSQADNDGRVFDPINRVGNWHNGTSFADIHTQSTRLVNESDGGSSGGMDDRFDFILVNDDVQDGEGLDYIPGTYVAWGQDGNRFNQTINVPTNTAVSAAVANALYAASDHLPVYMELQVPALAMASGDLEFGDVIQNAPVVRLATVANIALTPADDLDYTLAGSTGVIPAVGSFSLLPGASAMHLVAADFSTIGPFAGTLFVNSDADNSQATLPVSANVVSASDPSLDSVAVVTAGNVDFGTAPLGGFVDQTFEVHNRAYTASQAGLDVVDAQITGPDAARFSLVGFTPALVLGTPLSVLMHFDDTGATGGAAFSATLTLTTHDDAAVGGAADRADLVLDLSAMVDQGTAAPSAPRASALWANHPNPFNPATEIGFDLSSPSFASLVIYNVQGRVVRTLVNESLPAARHTRRWDGRADDGTSMSSGVYFYKLIAGDFAMTRRMVLVR